MAGAVLAAVFHAEVIAERVGEPYGALTLAVAVTVIEVGLPGRATLQEGGVHLLVLTAFLFLAFNP